MCVIYQPQSSVIREMFLCNNNALMLTKDYERNKYNNKGDLVGGNLLKYELRKQHCYEYETCYIVFLVLIWVGVLSRVIMEGSPHGAPFVLMRLIVSLLLWKIRYLYQYVNAMWAFVTGYFQIALHLWLFFRFCD